MLAFLLRRIVWALFLFLTATLLAYLIFFVMPTHPAQMIAGNGATPGNVARVSRLYHFNVSIWQRYWIFLWNIVRHGSFGNSYVSRQPVRALIEADAPVTASLVAGSAVMWLVISIPIGVLSAVRPRSLLLGDPTVSVVVLSGVNAEVVVTVAWEISWYQYRVAPDSENPVRLEGRGHDPGELDALFTDWNAHMEDDGRVVPDIARL